MPEGRAAKNLHKGMRQKKKKEVLSASYGAIP
jgi:hypothetical protein